MKSFALEIFRCALADDLGLKRRHPINGMKAHLLESVEACMHLDGGGRRKEGGCAKTLNATSLPLVYMPEPQTPARNGAFAATANLFKLRNATPLALLPFNVAALHAQLHPAAEFDGEPLRRSPWAFRVPTFFFVVSVFIVP